ncbi:MAG: peptidoglycan hydrolase FlgJ [Clostridiales bacterium]|nr:peptidoglycan hydrolase FlgJ [Clostridiales bacterium]
MKIDSASLTGNYDIASALQTVTDSSEGESFKTQLENAQAAGDDDAIKDVCKQFEAMFINLLLKQMRNTIQEGGLTEKSQARETFEGMLDEEMANHIAEGGGIGIADLMAKALTRQAYSHSDEEIADDTASIDQSMMDLITSDK